MARLVTNKKYEGEFKLNSFETIMASCKLIASKLETIGFINVVVTGNASTYYAKGLWPHATKEVELPKQVKVFKEIN